MKEIILLLILGQIINSHIFPQNDNYKCLDIQKKDVPTFLLNDKVLIGDLIYFYDSVKLSQIKSMNFLNSNDIPESLKNLGKYGIIEIKIPIQIDTKSIPEIKKWFKISDDKVNIAVDGFILENDTILIATEAINEIKILKTDNKVIGLNIWTLLPENRNGITTYASDGKIHIR